MQDKISQFMEAWDKIREGHIYDPGGNSKLEVTYGKKYAKVIDVHSGRSVMAFIDMATGDIYKAESWSRPAKHIRGNVGSPTHGMEAVDSPYSIRYLR